jgi:CubicO group peptidase (beta-lactamase class C family)
MKTTFNNLIIVLITSLLAGSLTAVNAQQKPLSVRIGEVERGLTPNTNILFADSALQQYSIEERMKYYGIPSVSITVIHNGKVDWAKAYGLANIAEKRAADENTLYQAASISKTVNAALILKLVQNGKLSLDEDIRSYLKTWTFPDNELSKNRPVTLRALLSHTAGINVHGFKGYTNEEQLPTINQVLDGKSPANSEAIKSIYAPGTKEEYSGGGIVITEKVIQDHVGYDYPALMNSLVLKPLQMSHSTFSQLSKAQSVNVADAYDSNMNAVPGKYYRYPEQSPDGLWTTAADYAKFIIAIQESLRQKQGAFLKPAMAKAMITPVLEDAGLGLFIVDKTGEKYFYHEGANVGYRSLYYSDLATGEGIVILINSDNRQIMDEIANSVAITYGWKNFYAPELRKLAVITTAQAGQLAGEYQSENPPVTLRVRINNGQPELNTHSGDAGFERMYCTGPDTFFLKSSPSIYAEFKGDVLEVTQDGKILLTAKKKK